MAKNQLPSVDAIKPGQMITAGHGETITSLCPEEQRHAEHVEGHGYLNDLQCYRAVDTRLVKAYHRVAFRNKLRQLIDSSATLKDGTRVSAKTDVLKWFLENCV